MNHGELIEELMDLMIQSSIEDLLKAMADICRGAEDIAMGEKEYQRAGTAAHYATTIEGLFEE